MTQPFTHKPTTVQAVQFDGRVATLEAIVGVVYPQQNGGGLTVNTYMDDNGISSVQMNGPAVGVAFARGQWVIFPDDSDLRPYAVEDADFLRDWGSGS